MNAADHAAPVGDDHVVALFLPGRDAGEHVRQPRRRGHGEHAHLPLPRHLRRESRRDRHDIHVAALPPGADPAALAQQELRGQASALEADRALAELKERMKK